MRRNDNNDGEMYATEEGGHYLFRRSVHDIPHNRRKKSTKVPVMTIGNPARFRILYLPYTNQESNRFISLYHEVLC
jgi:hypothetical protein